MPMNEQERRAEILRAEEAIRQLSAELAVATEARSQTEQARSALAAVTAELAGVRQSLDHAASQVSGVVGSAHESASAAATEALAAASERLNDSMGQVPGTVRKLEAAAALIAAMPAQVAEAVKLELSVTIAKLIDVSTAMKALSQQLVEIKQALSLDLDGKLREVVSSTRWAAFIASIAALAAIAAIILRFL